MKKFILIIPALLLQSCASTFTSDWDIPHQEKTQPNAKIEKDCKKPNVIIIVADDLGLSEVSGYGAKHIETPNIDAIGKNGVVFQQAYVTSPICAPSRASIMTGRYQQRFGFETQPMEIYPKQKWQYNFAKKLKKFGDWNIVTPPNYPTEDMWERQGIPLTEVTLPEIYQKVGYQTGMIGKWHLGYGKNYIPNARGFDYNYGFLGAFSIYTPKKNTKGYHNFIQDDFSSKHQWKTARKDNAKILKNGEEVIEEEYLTFAFTHKAQDFIENHKDTNFFLMLNYNAPHVPFQAPEKYYNMFSEIEDDNKRIYYAMIKALDDGVGELMSTLDQLNLTENTIVYFISDNGGASYTGATENGNLKGGKLTLFEGGVRVPFMMQWKGTIPAGKVYKAPVSSMDIFPTSLNASCIQTDLTQVDGVDLIPYLKNELHELPHEKLYWRSTHVRAIRYKKWKMVLSTRDHWLHLYNLENDKSESIDLKDLKNTELNNLKAFFEAWNSKLPSKPLWPRIMDRKFIIGEKVYYFPA